MAAMKYSSSKFHHQPDSRWLPTGFHRQTGFVVEQKLFVDKIPSPIIFQTKILKTGFKMVKTGFVVEQKIYLKMDSSTFISKKTDFFAKTGFIVKNLI